MEILTGQIKHYPWGSRHAIASLQGRPAPSAHPEAELWLGAHPGAPATVRREGDEVPISELITAQPQQRLGNRVAERFAGRLPFLLKVLAARQPLSLQAHPDAGLAARRWGQRHPGYVDAFHKPELLVALEPFEVLCGFAPHARSAALLRSFDVPELDAAAGQVAAGDLRAAVATLLTTRREDADRIIKQIVATPVTGVADERRDLVARLASLHPDDPAVLVSLLLNHQTLAPGEGVFMPAGNLHAYVKGLGVEVMAASDNVLRAGLTSKPVDQAEVLHALRYEALDTPIIRPRQVSRSLTTWDIAAEEFALWAVDVAAQDGRLPLPVSGPLVALSLGRLTAHDGDGDLSIGVGQAAVGWAGAGPVSISGDGRAFIASPGA